MEGHALLERDAAALAPPPPTRGERLALRLFQFGAVAVVLAAATWKVFELDRFFVPKELVLHATAFLTGVTTLAAFRRRTVFAPGDRLLLLFVLLSAVSAGFAQNPWLGARAVAITASGVVLYWVARTLARAGLERPLVGALALAVVVASAASLAQAYGLRTDFFSVNRAPGGTLGNRNFVAHLAAFGMPVVLAMSLRARSASRYFLWAVGASLVAAVLILTRSRAGWLAAGALMVVLAFALLASPALRRHGRTWLRLAGILVLFAAGVAGVLTLPNTLRWRSDSPYLESVRGVANFQEGSGRGRLIQYARSARLAAAHPLLGAGPGNWPVEYPEHAARRDPSLDPTAPGMTSNPWPSSDWVAFVSERGLLATLVLALALFALARGALRQLRSADAMPALGAAARLATLAAAVVAGLFDAVLLLAVPALIVWSALGALGGEGSAEGEASATPGRGWQTVALLALVLLSLGGMLRSGAQLTAMPLYATENTNLLRLAARIDPGNYRVRLRLARNGSREQRCAHAEAARNLFPNAGAAKRAARRCD